MTARGPDEFLSPGLTVCSSRSRRRRSLIARRSSIGRRDWSRCTSKARSRVLHHVNEFASCCRYGTYVETHEWFPSMSPVCAQKLMTLDVVGTVLRICTVGADV